MTLNDDHVDLTMCGYPDQIRFVVELKKGARVEMGMWG